jgi:hypothetical protein
MPNPAMTMVTMVASRTTLLVTTMVGVAFETSGVAMTTAGGAIVGGTTSQTKRCWSGATRS